MKINYIIISLFFLLCVCQCRNVVSTPEGTRKKFLKSQSQLLKLTSTILENQDTLFREFKITDASPFAKISQYRLRNENSGPLPIYNTLLKNMESADINSILFSSQQDIFFEYQRKSTILNVTKWYWVYFEDSAHNSSMLTNFRSPEVNNVGVENWRQLITLHSIVD